MGPLSGMDVALLDQWQLLSHFLQNLIFRFLQSKSRIQFWLFEQKDMRIEGRIIGFDEYMNLVLDDAEEISLKKKTRKPLGRILLKGDNITLMMNTGK
jgi:small nuclear ribonucleoprotein E